MSPRKPEDELVIADDLDEVLEPEVVPDTLPAPEEARPCPHPQPHGSKEGRHSGRPHMVHKCCRKDCKKAVHGLGAGVRYRDHANPVHQERHPDTGDLVPMDIPVHRDLHEVPAGKVVREVRLSFGGHVHNVHHWTLGGAFCYDVTPEGLVLHPCPEVDYDLEIELEDAGG